MFPLARLRNFGVMAHVDAGKTTLSERILFLCGRMHRIGEVHDGATQLDHLPQERKRGITITAAATTCLWDEHTLNLIDTPGHVDFTVEVQRSLRVLDGAVAVFDAVAGVEPQTETVWRQADERGVARLCFVNKMDRPGADFDQCVAEIRDRLGAHPVTMHLPYFRDDRFAGLFDLLELRLLMWPDSQDIRSIDVQPIPAEHIERARVARRELVEDVASKDETLLALWSCDADVPATALADALRRLVIAGAVTPVLCGSALANIGVQPLLDAIVRLLPSPLDVPPAEAFSAADRTERTPCAPSPDGPLVALAFKVTHRQHGKSTWLRIYSGTLTEGSRACNASTGRVERVTRLVRLHADGGEQVREASAGDIVAVIGLDGTRTGHTVCEVGNSVLLEAPEFPEPVMAMAIEPCTSDDQDKLSIALRRLCDEDPTFRAHVDSETGDTIIAGMGELHLEVLVDRLATDHGVRVRTGPPKVAYRETITRPVLGHVHRHVKQRGGPGQFAHIVVDIEPTDEQTPGAVEFVDRITGGVVPSQYVAATAAGVADALACGPVAGYPLVGCKVALIDGSTHPNDSSEFAFRAAGAAAMRAAAKLADPVLLEPVMRVTSRTPEGHLGAVLGLIGSRRGVVVSVDDHHGHKEVTAEVPLAELFGFAGELRSVSQGRASTAMTLARYQAVCM